MKIGSKKKKEIIQWIVFLAVIVILWVTGWHRPVVVGVQRAILLTGAIQPKISGREEANHGKAIHLRLFDEAGKQVELVDYRGKAVFLNIWATWCPPCRAEMPGIQKLYEEIDDNKVQFVMIVAGDDFKLAQKYKEENGYTFPIFRLGSNFPEEMSGNTIPRTYILDANGSIRAKHKGMAHYNTKKFRKFLSGLSREN